MTKKQRSDYSKAIEAILSAGYHSHKQVTLGKENLETYARLDSDELVMLRRKQDGTVMLYIEAGTGLEAICKTLGVTLRTLDGVIG